MPVNFVSIAKLQKNYQRKKAEHEERQKLNSHEKQKEFQKKFDRDVKTFKDARKVQV